LAGALLLRLLVFVLFRPWEVHVQDESILIFDARGYHRLALCIVDSLTLCGDTFRTPGYPFFLAIFYKLFGAKPWMALLGQIPVDLVSIYFLFRIGELIQSRSVATISATLLAIDPNTVFAATNLYSDGLFVAFLMASLYFFLRGIKEPLIYRNMLISGFLLGLAALVRPVAQYYVLLLLLFTVFWPNRGIARNSKSAILYVIAFMIAICPWLYRNYDLYGTAKLSSIQGDNLLFWQVAYTRAWETKQSGAAVNAELMTQAEASGYLKDGNPFLNEAITQKIAVAYVKTHPVIYAHRWLSGMLHIYANLDTADIVLKLGWKPTRLSMDTMFADEGETKLMTNFFKQKSASEIGAGLVVLPFLLASYTAALLGAITMVRSGRIALVLLFLVSILYFTATGGPIGLARFRLPITPFYLLMAAVFIDQLLRRRQSEAPTPAFAAERAPPPL